MLANHVFSSRIIIVEGRHNEVAFHKYHNIIRVEQGTICRTKHYLVIGVSARSIQQTQEANVDRPVLQGSWPPTVLSLSASTENFSFSSSIRFMLPLFVRRRQAIGVKPMKEVKIKTIITTTKKNTLRLVLNGGMAESNKRCPLIARKRHT